MSDPVIQPIHVMKIRLDCDRRLMIVGTMLVGMVMLLPTKPALAHPGHGVFIQSLAEQSLTPTMTLTGLGVTFLFGTGHALAPGHCKPMVAAYLVGSRGTPKHALLLGLVTTITHTLGVFALGILTLFASRYVLPEQLYPVLSFLSGLTICGIGFWLLDSRLHDSEHKHDEHLNHYHHSTPEAPITLRSLIALGIAGGIVPCPSALVLLLSASPNGQAPYSPSGILRQGHLHQAASGIVLLGAFSLGLASVLVTIGLVAVYACQWLNRLPSGGVMLRLPVVNAIAIILTGAVLTAGVVI